MMDFDIKGWYEEQVAWWKKEIAWYERQIAFENKMLKEYYYPKDKEMLEYVWSKGVLTELEYRIWGDPKNYHGDEALASLKLRAKYYRKKMLAKRQLLKYTKLLEEVS